MNRRLGQRVGIFEPGFASFSFAALERGRRCLA